MMSPTLHIFSLMSNSQTANTGRLTLHKKPLANIRENDFPVFDPLEKKYQKKCKKFAFLYCQFKYYSYLCSANKLLTLIPYAMDNSKLLVVQVLIDVADDIMHEESYNPVTGIVEYKGDTEIERKKWCELFTNIVAAHNDMLVLVQPCLSDKNHMENYDTMKAAIRKMVDNFQQKDNGCQNCTVKQYPPCDKGVPCCQCKEQCNSRQPCPKKGGEK